MQGSTTGLSAAAGRMQATDQADSPQTDGLQGAQVSGGVTQSDPVTSDGVTQIGSAVVTGTSVPPQVTIQTESAPVITQTAGPMSVSVGHPAQVMAPQVPQPAGFDQPALPPHVVAMLATMARSHSRI